MTTNGNPRRRIAMTSYYLPSESKIGAGWAAHRLANELVKRDHDVTMFSPCSKPEDAEYEHIRVAVEGRLRTFKWPFALRRIDFSSFDVLHAHGDDHLLKRRRTPRVHVRTLHGSCFDEALYIRGAKNRLRMILLGITEAVASVRTPVVVGVSRNSLRFYPWCRIVIPNGVDADRFSSQGHRADTPTILFVGTYGGRKRGRLLAQAFKNEVLPKIDNAQLWMVSTDAPSAPNVDVLGRLSDEQLAERYRRAWVFCLPSSYEGFGIPYIEAMASGLRIVATPNRGAKEILAGCKSADLVEPEHLGEALIEALGRERLATKDAAVARFEWSTVLDAYERLYA